MANHTMFQFFQWFYPQEEHLWRQVAKEAARLQELGISGVWLPPAYKAASGVQSIGYDTYDLYDLGEFDQKDTVPTHYGNKDEYLSAIKALHDHDIQTYADVVFNHKAGADETEEVMAHEVDPDDRRKIISEDYKIKARTKFIFPGRKGKYSDFIWNYNCFSGTDWDENQKKHGIFKILNDYGSKWEKLLTSQKGNFDFLMFSDIEFRNQSVRDELKKWGLWYLQTTVVDGFRLDAIKHISPSFFPEWLQYLSNESHRDIFAVGEYQHPVSVMLRYLKTVNYCMSLFDFPLHWRFRTASIQGEKFDLRSIFNKTLTAADPVHSVTFVDNHDTQELREVNQEVKSWFYPHAYALILLRAGGYPCVFYPDLYGCKVNKKDKMGTVREIEVKPSEPLEKILLARKENAYGEQKDYFMEPNLIGWTRDGAGNPASGLAVVLSNRSEGSLEMEMGKQHAGKTCYELTGSRQDKITLNEDAKACFPVNAGSIAIWLPQKD